MQIQVNNVTYTYMKDTPFERQALTDVNVTIASGKYTSIIGHTGSGKSTLIQQLNGLLKPTEGTLQIGEWNIRHETKQKNLYELRRHVGMVFQYPEHQLFHETVLMDVAYGPMNFGSSKVDAEEKAKAYLTLVGIPPSAFERSPFELSGGQMRRVAIAGTLALDPKLLILDEPTAGLDPQGQEMIMELFYRWFREKQERSIILVTHQMEDAAKFSDEIIIMANGKVIEQGTPKDIYSQPEKLNEVGLTVPESVQLLSTLQGSTCEKIDLDVFTTEETVQSLLTFLRKKGVNGDV